MTGKLRVGAKICVKTGVAAPDVPEVEVAGWTGTVTQIKKHQDGKRCFVEWDKDTLEAMPAQYLQFCQDRMLYHLMACFDVEDLDVQS